MSPWYLFTLRIVFKQTGISFYTILVVNKVNNVIHLKCFTRSTSCTTPTKHVQIEVRAQETIITYRPVQIVKKLILMILT